MKKYTLLKAAVLLLLVTARPVYSASTASETAHRPASGQLSLQAELFPLSDVRLLDSPFKHAEDLDIQYLLALQPDRLLAPYLREAGLSPKAESYTNWENTGLDGHIGGHYVSALSLMYAATGNEEIKARLDYMLSELKKCQEHSGNGYLGGIPGSRELWTQIAAGDIRAEAFDLNKRWVPLYNIHKIYGGLRDAWLYAGSSDAKEMLVKLTDWMLNTVSSLSDDQIQEMLKSEHGGLNEVFADVASITGDRKYLRLARQFSHQQILQPLLRQEDRLTGLHANTQIPKVIGFKRIADLEGDTDWNNAAAFFWETVVNRRSVSIGANSVREHFHPADDYSSMMESEEGPETCNTYNMLKLTKMLYQTCCDDKYIEYYERALYNHILSTENPRTGGFVYFTPMRAGHYRVYSQPQTSFWCCVGSGLENHAKYGEMIYARQSDTLLVNLFIPSRLQWKEKDMEIIQANRFPEEETTRLTVSPARPTRFTLCLRYPEWVEKGALKVSVNNEPVTFDARPGSYLPLTREWKKGDVVEMTLPMHLSASQLPDKSNYYSFLYGPIVLAAATDTTRQTGLFADDSRGGHIAHGPKIPSREIPLVVGEPDKLTSLLHPVAGKPLTFTLTSLYPENRGEMTLMPFFRIYESRYILYWQQASAAEAEEIRKRTEEQEKETLQLDAVTLDAVICGEQQPESDHFIRSEQSTIGDYEGLHWREARGWFSYELKNPAGKARTLRIVYHDYDPSRSFSLLWNGTPLQAATTDRRADGFTVITYSLSSPQGKTGKATVRFEAAPGSLTPKVFEIRLMK